MIALYFRVSSGLQAADDRYSLEAQQRSGEEFAKRINEPFETYQDIKSAYHITIKREEVERLIADIEKGSIEKVWVIDVDRLCRSQEEGIFFRQLFQKHNIEFYEKDKLVSFDQIQEKLLYSIRTIFAEFEIDQFKQRIKRGKEISWMNGNKIFSGLLGYTYEYNNVSGKKIYSQVPEEIELLKFIFNMRLQGKSYYDMAKTLNDENYPTKRNSIWGEHTLHKIINNIIYTGYYNFNNELIKSNIYSEIIPLETFQRLQKDRIYKHRSYYASRHQLTSLIICECGGRLYHRQPQNKQKQYYYFKHMPECQQKNHYFQYHLLNKIIDTSYLYLCSDQRKIEELFIEKNENLLDQKNKLDKDNIRYHKRLDEIDQQKNRLIDNVAKGILEESEVKDHIVKIRIEEYKINKLLNENQVHLNLSEDEYYYLLDEFQENSALRYVHSEEANKRQILKKIMTGSSTDRQFEITFLEKLVFNFELSYAVKVVDVKCYDNKILKIGLEELVYPEDIRIDQREFLYSLIDYV